MNSRIRKVTRKAFDGVKLVYEQALEIGDKLGVVNPDQIYNDEWYAKMQDEEWHSDAKIITDSLIDEFNPNSVLDLGCGVGLYLNQFQENGVEIKGVDGADGALRHNTVNQKYLEKHDLREPYRTTKQYDLVLCFEVLEHVPERYADTLVKSIVEGGETIVVTAATPGQGGTHHVNEQPREYWIRKFEERGVEYRPDIVEIFRTEMNSVEKTIWIPENIFVFN